MNRQEELMLVGVSLIVGGIAMVFVNAILPWFMIGVLSMTVESAESLMGQATLLPFICAPAGTLVVIYAAFAAKNK